MGGRAGRIYCKTTVSPRGNRVFLVSKRTLFFFWEEGGMDASYWSGSASWAW